MTRLPFFSLITACFAAMTAASLGQGLAPPRLTAPSPEETPTPAATAAPSATQPVSAPEPAAKRTPARSEPERNLSSPRRDVLREDPVRALEPRQPFIRRVPAQPQSGRRASQPTFDLSESSWVVAATIRSLENRWEAAVKDHDVEALGKLLSSNFEATSATGREASKSRMLSLLRRDNNVYHSARAHGMRVKAVAADTALVTGTSTESGVTADGKKFHVSRAFSDTWKLRKNRWQCVASRILKGKPR